MKASSSAPTDDPIRAAIDTAMRHVQYNAPKSLLHRIVTAAYGDQIPAEPANGSIRLGRSGVWVRDDSLRDSDWWDSKEIDQEHAKVASWAQAGSGVLRSWAEAWYLDGCEQHIGTSPHTGPSREEIDAYKAGAGPADPF